jgi:hypothetical protein
MSCTQHALNYRKQNKQQRQLKLKILKRMITKKQSLSRTNYQFYFENKENLNKPKNLPRLCK